MRRRSVAATACALAAALLAGCGAPQSTPRPAPTPGAEVLTTAVMRTKALGTASIEVEADVSLPGVARSARASGAVSLDRGTGEVTWVTSDGDRAVARRTAKGRYVKAADSSGWVLDADPSQWRVATMDPLRGLGGVMGLSAQPVPSGTLVTGRVAASAAELSLLGLGQDEIARLGADWSDATVKVDVTVDTGGRVTSVVRTLVLPEGRVRLSVELTGYRVPLNLMTPASVTATR